MKVFCFAVFSLLFFTDTNTSDPGISLTWTGNQTSNIWEPNLTADPIQRFESHMFCMDQCLALIPKTANNCVNFARHLIPHHWCALVMALDAINLGPNDSIITPIAQVVVESQATIDLEAWLVTQGLPWEGPNQWTYIQNSNDTEFNQSVPDSPFAQLVLNMQMGMANTPLIGDVNLDFARQMIPHHSTAIAMAQVVNGTCDEAVNVVADQIITVQSQQIEDFKVWLGKRGWAWEGGDFGPNSLGNGSNMTNNANSSLQSENLMAVQPLPGGLRMRRN